MPRFARSDLVFTAPTGSLARQVERYRELAMPRLQVKLVDHLVPGQPLALAWKFNRFAGDGPASVTARFLIDGQVVREHPGVQASDANEGTAVVAEEMMLLPAHYYIGDNPFVVRRLDVEVIDDATGQRVARQPRNIRVIHEGVDRAWWTWREHFAMVDWKHDFTLNADFRNGLKYAAIQTLTVELFQVRIDDAPGLDPCWYGEHVETVTRNGIGIGATTSFAFARFEDWHWISPGTFHIFGPMDKTFAYAVEVALTDAYGNVYGYRDMHNQLHPVFCSGAAQRWVAVSDSKKRAGVVAMSAAIDAAGLMVAAGIAAATIVGIELAAALTAAAGVAYGIGHAAYENAEDPPEPAGDFREPTGTIPMQVRGWSRDSGLERLEQLMALAVQWFALENARTLARARLMGARLFRDDAAWEMQRQCYVAIEREMSLAAAAARKLLPEVQATIEQLEVLDPARLAASLDALLVGGANPAAHPFVVDAGLSRDQLASIHSVVMDRTAREVLRANGLVLEPLVASLEAMTSAIGNEREGILQGETPPARLPAGRRRVSLEDELDQASAMRPRRASRRCSCGP